MKVRAVSAVCGLQAFLCLAHWFIYCTLSSFRPVLMPSSPSIEAALRGVILVFSFSFIAAALLAHRFSNPAVATLYKLAALWMGLLNFLFWAACLCWVAALAVRLAAPSAYPEAKPWIGLLFFGLAIVITAYGLINARVIRERRITVKLPNLPASWKGRTALLVTDVHLGNVNGAGFSRRIVKIATRLDPAIVFIAGDLYDGSKVDASRVASPLFSLKPPLGVYFCGGNHEEFGNAAEYSAALVKGGIRVLHNERVIVDGLQLIGVSYSDAAHPAPLRTFLRGLHLSDGPASILLNHVPHRLPVVEQSGVNLQLSGHTHGGQVFPFTIITRWIYGQFTYGLQRFGELQVFTSTGVGTWGPPMRVGTQPEVVLITFEEA